MNATFRSLSVRNYRLYFSGQLLSNIGTWMQRVAQDWLVLVLSGGSGIALGITTALQFAPYLLFSLVGGTLADRMSRRRLLVVTQALMGVLAVLLGFLTLRGSASVELVYVFAFLLGIVSAVDNPSRQAFVGELVPGDELPNAVALNSASFNAGRIVGPALAGLLIASLGTGWVFVLNGLSFAVTIGALFAIRAQELHLPSAKEGPVRLSQGLRYVQRRKDLMLVMVLVAGVAFFALNFQITLALMANQEFGLGPEAYGLLSTVMAVGSLAGSLLAARRALVPLPLVVLASAVFSVMVVLIGLSPTYLVMLLALPIVGITAMTFVNTAQSYLQLKTESWVRGRVMGLYTLVFFGGTPVGAPLIGWAADHLGARSGLIVGGLGALAVTLVAYAVLYRRGTPDVTSPLLPSVRALRRATRRPPVREHRETVAPG